MSPVFAIETMSFRLPSHWVGGFSRDGSIERAEITFEMSGDSLLGSYSIPELGLFDEPLRDVVYSASLLTFRCIHGPFECQVDTMYQEFTGINEKWQPPVRVHFKRAERQWPEVRQQAVTIANEDVTLAGTIFRPESPGKYRAVVILHGGDDTTRAVWTYQSLGVCFARNGYIALVYDKRGYGASTGKQLPSLKEQADDATAAINFLRGQAEVLPNQVGVIGASQSGWVAPMLGSEANPAFYILLSAPAYSPEQQEKDRVEFTLRQEGIAEDTIRVALNYTQKFFDAVNGKFSWDSLLAQSNALQAHEWSQYLPLVEAREDLEWFRANAYEPAKDLKKIRAPVLALYGEHDPLVPPERNAELMEKHLTSGGNTHVRVVVFPRGSHLIEDWGTLTGGEWNWPSGYWKWSRRAPGYFETIFEWMKILP